MGNSVVSFPQIPLYLQMLHNLQQSLAFLAGRGVAVEEVSASDVHQGNLKAILGLFFQLSRYKQQQKQLQMQQQQVSKMCMQVLWLSTSTWCSTRSVQRFCQQFSLQFRNLVG